MELGVHTISHSLMGWETFMGPKSNLLRYFPDKHGCLSEYSTARGCPFLYVDLNGKRDSISSTL
jgi:hypothetical protein